MRRKQQNNNDATMTDQALTTMKRVISKDCSEDVREEKKSKTKVEPRNEGAAAAFHAAPKALADEADAPVAVVRVPSNPSQSSLSTEGGDGTQAADGAEAAARPPRSPPSRPTSAPAGAATAAGRSPGHDGRKGSFNGSAASSSDTSGGRNWGWFEDADVHGHESMFLPEVSAAKSGAGGASVGNDKGKSRGLLQVGSELIQNVLQTIVEPNRQGERAAALPI